MLSWHYLHFSLRGVLGTGDVILVKGHRLAFHLLNDEHLEMKCSQSKRLDDCKTFDLKFMYVHVTLSQTFVTHIWLVVRVPVLSEQMTEVQPKVSTEGRERTMAFFFAMRRVPRARQVVMTAGRPVQKEKARLVKRMTRKFKYLPKMPFVFNPDFTPQSHPQGWRPQPVPRRS